MGSLKSEKLDPFRGRDYRTFAENFLAKSQDTRKPRIISRSANRLKSCIRSTPRSRV